MGRADASGKSQRTGQPAGVVAVGASAGGVEALTAVAAGLPEDLPYALLVVLHMPSGGSSRLASILDRSGPLPAVPATDEAALHSGRIYVCVPDHHLLMLEHRVMLSQGPSENGYRPAINALFRSVALAYGPRAIGLLLSGVLDDGVLGTAAIRARGGTTVAQEPGDAAFAAMPQHAIEAGLVDHTVAAADVGRLLAKLAEREIGGSRMERDTNMELENRIAMGRRFSVAFDSAELGPPAGYVCPDCNGSLHAVTSGSFRCHVGHAWTADSLLRSQDEEVEKALWVALRSLQEKSKLARRMHESARQVALRRRYAAVADESEHAMKVLSERLADVYGNEREHGAG